MSHEEKASEDPISLRERAERITGADEPPSLGPPSPEEAGRTLQEPQVHQIELQMQNEELRRAQVELDAERARYFDLFELAPVGYVTVSDKGLILEANLTAAHLLGVDRGTWSNGGWRVSSSARTETASICNSNASSKQDFSRFPNCEWRGPTAITSGRA